VFHIFSKITKKNVKFLLKPFNFQVSLVTFWHETCLPYNNEPKNNTMIDLNSKYENAKLNSMELMKNGQISAYFNALLEMNKYKRLMIAIVAN
jgi:hypothetical protein